MTIPFNLTLFCLRDLPKGKQIVEFTSSIRDILEGGREPDPVSYTHLDVYKRQGKHVYV